MELTCDKYSYKLGDAYSGQLRAIELVLRRIQKRVNRLPFCRFAFWKRVQLSYHPSTGLADCMGNMLVPPGPEMFHLHFGREKGGGALRWLLFIERADRVVISSEYSNSEIRKIIRSEFVTFLPDIPLSFTE